MRVIQTLRTLQEQRVVWLTFATLAVAGQFADILTTLAFLGAGGSEHNALGAFLMRTGDWPLLVGCKLLLALTLGWVLVAFAVSPVARRSLAGRVTLIVGGLFAVGWWLIIGWNLAVWLVMAHALPWMSGR